MRRSAMIFLVPLVAACASNSNEPRATPQTGVFAPMFAPVEARESPVVLMAATFESVATKPNPIIGQAFITDSSPDRADDPFGIHVQLDHVPPGEHAWHIHAGGCDVHNSPVVLALSSTADMKGITGPLVANADLTVDASVSIPRGPLTVEDLQTKAYSLHVYARSGADHGPIIACANL